MTEKTKKITSDTHRKNNVWDVTYDESIDIDNFIGARIYELNELSVNHKQFQCYIIDFSFEKAGLPDETLEYVKEKADRLYIKDITFNTCDFIGANEGKKITFINCYFEKSYFGYSNLTDVNFENCNFKNTSFALTKFSRCRFDDLCVFSEISISGGKTDFNESVISASKFIDSIYIYATKDYCKKHPSKNIHEERSRMYTSMVKLSRNILESVSKNGDDDFFYNAVKQVYKLKIKDRHHKKIWEIKKKKPKGFIRNIIPFIRCCIVKAAMPLETGILNVLGFLNGWGSSVSRCFLFGMLILFSFSITYYFRGAGAIQPDIVIFPHLIKSIIQSFDITFLAGYTKYVKADDDYHEQLVCLFNMLLGLMWYAISIPTVINKISINRI